MRTDPHGLIASATGETGPPPTRWAAWREPGMGRYLLGTLVSMSGTGMQFVATSWLVLNLTNAHHSVAIVLICTSVPGILLSPVAGVLVDRVDGRRLAAGTDAFRALTLLAVVGLYAGGSLAAWHLYLMSFLLATGDLVWNTAVLGLVRQAVRPSLLLSANAATSAAVQAGTVLGALLSGLVIAVSSPAAVMVLNAGSFAFSAGCVIGMARARTGPARTGVRSHRFLDDLRAGAGYVRAHQYLIPAYLALLVVTFTVRVINVLLAPFTKDVLHAGTTALGGIDAAFGVGALIGNLVLLRLARRIDTQRLMVGGLLVLALSTALFGLAPSVSVAVLGYLLIGVAYPVKVFFLTAAQEQTDPAYQGRVYATFMTFASGSNLLVYLVVGLLADAVSPRWLYAGQAVLLLATAYGADRVRRRRSTSRTPIAVGGA